MKSMKNNGPISLRASILSRVLMTAVVVLVAGPAQIIHAQSASLWTQKAASPIDSLTLTPLGSVLVLEKGGGLAAIDPLTGSKVWTRNGILSHAFASRTHVVLAESTSAFTAIDLETGRDLWSSASLPFTKIVEARLIGQDDAVLVVGSTPQTDHMLIAVDLVSGQERWRQTTLFSETPQLAKKAKAIRYNEVLSDANALVLNPTYGGLIRLDLTSGAVLWRTSDKALSPTKALSTGGAPMLAADGRLFIATGKTLAVVDAASGRLIAKRKKSFPTPIVQMALTSKGLLVRGTYTLAGAIQRHAWKSYLALVDPATGNSIWTTEGARPALDVRSEFVVRDDGVLIALKKGLALLDLATGNVLKAATFPEFQDSDGPGRVEAAEDGTFFLTSGETTRRVDWNGRVLFDKYYKAPGVSMFAKFAMAAAYGMAGYAIQPMLAPGLASVFSRQRAAADAEHFRYVLAEMAEAGSVRSALVRLDKTTGTEAGRVVFDERRPNYVLDSSTGIVIFATDQTLKAARFPTVSATR
jgi:outer membrane protein assembly factor BamB